MKHWTWGSNILVVSALLASGFVASGKLLSNSPLDGHISQDVEDLYRDLLEQAQTDAEQNRIKQAVVAIAGIPPNSRYHATAQQLREQWSKDLLRLARNYYSKSQLKEAIALLKTIPSSTSVYAQAKNLQENWMNQSKRLEQAEQAYSDGNWDQGLQLLESLKNTEIYRSPRVQEMLQLSINAAFDPGDAASDLSTPDRVLPARLTAEAPGQSQVAVEPAPKLSAIALNVDRAMEISDVSSISSRTPEQDLQQLAQQNQPKQVNLAETVVAETPTVDQEASESNLSISASSIVVPVVADVPTVSEANDFSPETEAIDSEITAALSNAPSIPSTADELACLLPPEFSPASPEFSPTRVKAQSKVYKDRHRQQTQNTDANSKKSNSEQSNTLNSRLPTSSSQCRS